MPQNICQHWNESLYAEKQTEKSTLRFDTKGECVHHSVEPQSGLFHYYTHIHNGFFHPSIVATIDPSSPRSGPSKSIMDSPICQTYTMVST